MPEPLPNPHRPSWVLEDLADARGRGIHVAVIDSGCDRTWSHPQIHRGIGLVEPGETIELGFSADAHDRLGHGTACCDILLGIAPEAEIHPIRVFGSTFETSPESIAAGIRIAVDRGYDVVNLSLGSHRSDIALPLYEICESARQQGVVVVAAVQFGSGTGFPAAFDNVLGVQAGRFANIFDYEIRRGKAADCIAQGDRDVRWLDGQRLRIFGSSFAAPHISGLVALLKERHPELDLEGIRTYLARYACPTGTCVSRGADGPAEITAKEVAELAE